jgi:hypothetical protein
VPGRKAGACALIAWIELVRLGPWKVVHPGSQRIAVANQSAAEAIERLRMKQKVAGRERGWLGPRAVGRLRDHFTLLGR